VAAPRFHILDYLGRFFPKEAFIMEHRMADVPTAAKQDRSLMSVVIALVATLVFFLGIFLIGRIINPSLDLGDTALIRFFFVIVGMLITFLVYFFTRTNAMWVVGTKEVVYMAIGAALFAVFSFLFNGTVFVVPSVSQVALRPAIAIPMFFGYAFGPVVGFFTGAVGNMFGDALTGFGLSPQWSVGNGLIGLIAGLVWLFKDKKRSLDTLLIVSGVLAVLATLLYVVYRTTPNLMYFAPDQNIFGDAPISPIMGISLFVGFAMIVIVRYLFRQDVDVAAAVTWSMLGNILGLGFAALSDIWVNGYSPVTAIVGEFLPAAGPNLIFAAILVPILVLAYSSVRRQSGR
jgi:hypothetical protein